ncbi:MAG: hypothetical protein ACKVS8_07880 [Phycisphaerales bacterium]
MLHLADDAPLVADGALPSRHTVLRPAAPSTPGRDYRVGDSPATAARPARHAVAKANILASGMSPLDARWVLARRVSEQLDGGRAAILPPDRRQALVAAGVRLGLREFDVNLVIAIVQDGRRIGKGALNPQVEARLKMVPEAAPLPASRISGWLPVMAAVLGLLVCAALVLWVRIP